MSDDEYAVLESIPRFAGRVISVRTDRVQMSDGSVGTREVVAHLGAVAVVAVDEADQVVLVSQFRHPVRAVLDELPAGLLDIAGESALVAAQRELAEEAALVAADWQVLVDVLTSPGMTDEAVRIYLARGLSEVPAEGRFVAEHEELTMTVHREPLATAVSRVFDGSIRNGIAVAGILAAAMAAQDGRPLRPADAAWTDKPGR